LTASIRDARIKADGGAWTVDQPSVPAGERFSEAKVEGHLVGPFPHREERIAVDDRLLRRLREKGEPLEEVVLVARRPDGQVLLHTKRFYPLGIWRLPSGRLKEGESPQQAARREAAEELGIVVLHERLLGLLTYRLEAERESLSFASWVFLVPVSGIRPVARDREEQITDFCWMPVAQLETVAQRLKALPPPWQGWGRFRAAVHAFVAAELGKGS